MRRPAEKVTPGAVARFSFEPSRSLGPYPPWCSSLEESPGSSRAERCDQLCGRSDQPAWGLAYAPQMRGSSGFDVPDGWARAPASATPEESRPPGVV